MARQIRLELLPHERAALLKGNFTIDEVLRSARSMCIERGCRDDHDDRSRCSLAGQ